MPRFPLHVLPCFDDTKQCLPSVSENGSAISLSLVDFWVLQGIVYSMEKQAFLILYEITFLAL